MENKENENRKVSDFPMNIENPFLKEMIQDMEPAHRRRLVTPTNKEVVQTVYNDKSGEVIGHTAFMQYVEVDDHQFAKLYLNNIAAFWDLPKPAIRVFSYIMTTIKPNQDKVYFLLDECIEYTGYKSKTMVFTGLAALLENKIIARGRTFFEFFINPLVAFNGNRITFAKTYIKKKIKKQASEDQLNLFGSIDNSGFGRLKKLNKQFDHEPEKESEE